MVGYEIRNVKVNYFGDGFWKWAILAMMLTYLDTWVTKYFWLNQFFGLGRRIGFTIF